MKTTKRNFTRHLMLLLILLFIYSLFSSGCSSVNNGEINDDTDKVAFFWKPKWDHSGMMQLILADENGNSLRYIGDFSGTTSFSRDGSLLAVGCPPPELSIEPIVSDLCVLDINKFKSTNEEIQVRLYDTYDAIIQRIRLPEVCQFNTHREEYVSEGIFSIDWSPGVDRLLIVCGTGLNQDVCILPLQGNPICWNKEASKGVFRAVWSPIDDGKILISGWTSQLQEIYLVNPEGERIKQIAVGWNPEWSSDGTKMVYIEGIIGTLGHGISQGIAMIDIDGTNHQWLFNPNLKDDQVYIVMNGIADGRLERLAWSPDNKFIIFSGTFGDWLNYALFKLDICTGKVSYFVDPGIFSFLVTEPDWAP
jgi:hypothetical protein